MNLTPRAPEPGRDFRIPSWFGLLTVVGLWLARSPYRGVRHDAILYLAQAFSHVNPSWAARDVFFAGGSQDRYSVFSPLLARLIGPLGIGPAEILLLLAAWALALVALLRLSAGLPPLLRWLGLAAVLGASHFYAAGRLFSFFEPFLTARSWAEPLSLLALAWLIEGRRALALVALAAALACHPLMALPAAAIGLAWLIGQDRRWAWALLAGVPVLVLAALHVAPFDALLQVYDDTWYRLTFETNQTVFLTQWKLPDVIAALMNLGLLLWFARRDDTPLARLARAAVVAAVALCGVSFIGADLCHDVLITQLQLWRVLWIVDVLALLTLPSLLAREWAAGPAGQLAAVAVLVAAAVVDTWLSTAWALLAWAALALALRARGAAMSLPLQRVALVGTWLAGLVATGVQAMNARNQMLMHQQGTALADPVSIPFTLPLLTLPLALLVFWSWRRGGIARVAAGAAVAALLAFAGLHWDQRTDWSRYLESFHEQGRHPFAADIPAGAQVYWYEDVLADWVLLGRPSFVSDNQFSGLLFSRANAEAARQRQPLMAPILQARANCNTLEYMGIDGGIAEECDVPREPIVHLCHASPQHADWVVVPGTLGPGARATWRFQPPGGRVPPVTYSLYDCRQLH